MDVCTREILEQIIDDALLEVREPHEVILNMVRELVDQIPYDYIKSDVCLEYIGKKISQTDFALDKNHLLSTARSSDGAFRDEIVAILEQVLEHIP